MLFPSRDSLAHHRSHTAGRDDHLLAGGCHQASRLCFLTCPLLSSTATRRTPTPAQQQIPALILLTFLTLCYHSSTPLRRAQHWSTADSTTKADHSTIGSGT